MSSIGAGTAAAPRARAQSAGGAPASISVTVLGDRSDVAALIRSIETLLDLDHVEVKWRRGPARSSPEDGPPPTPSSRALLLDLRDPGHVGVRMLPSDETSAAERVVDAASFDEVTCETLAQIVRSIVLAPVTPARPVVTAVAPAPVRAPPPVPAPVAASPAERRFDLRLGYAVDRDGSLGLLSGLALAGSWALTGGTSRPLVHLSVARASATFSSDRAPASASFVVWSARAGLGWERSWRDRWWLAFEAGVGADHLQVTPTTKGQSDVARLAPSQSAVRIAARAALRAEVALRGAFLAYVQLQAETSPRVRLYIAQGTQTRTFDGEAWFHIGGTAGVAIRWR